MVTALASGRSPHGEDQMELFRLRPLALPLSHPLAKIIVFFCYRLVVFQVATRPPLFASFLRYSLHFSLLSAPTVVTVVVNASAVCTIAVAVGVIVTVMYPLCKHGMTVVIAIDNVDMTRTLIIYCLCHC